MWAIPSYHRHDRMEECPTFLHGTTRNGCTKPPLLGTPIATKMNSNLFHYHYLTKRTGHYSVVSTKEDQQRELSKVKTSANALPTKLNMQVNKWPVNTPVQKCMLKRLMNCRINITTCPLTLNSH